MGEGSANSRDKQIIDRVSYLVNNEANELRRKAKCPIPKGEALTAKLTSLFQASTTLPVNGDLRMLINVLGNALRVEADLIVYHEIEGCYEAAFKKRAPKLISRWVEFLPCGSLTKYTTCLSSAVALETSSD